MKKLVARTLYLRLLSTVLLLSAAALGACSSGDGQPSASSDPQLTAQEIANRISSKIDSARLVSVRHADIGGRSLDDRMEGTIVGDNLFLKRGDVQVLYLSNKTFTRMSDDGPWIVADPSLRPALADFQFMGFSKRPQASSTPEPTAVARLPDETIDGHQVFHLSVTVDLSKQDADFAGTVAGYLTGVPFAPVRSINPLDNLTCARRSRLLG